MSFKNIFLSAKRRKVVTMKTNLLFSYEAFKEELVKRLQEKLQMEISVRPVEKTNEVLDGISFMSENSNVSPTLYVNYAYEDYKKSKDFDEVFEHLVSTYQNAMEKSPDFDIAAIRAGEKKEERIVFELINTEDNKELLSKHPHRQFLDMSIVYRYVVSDDGEGRATILISNDLAASWNVTENDLYEMAYNNTRKFSEIITEDLQKTMMGYFGGDEDEELEITPDSQMVVITNKSKVKGAAVIIYTDVLSEIAEKINNDIVLLPSSVHEFLAVNVRKSELRSLGKETVCENFADMVNEVNVTQVNLEERLSNQVYYFDRKTKELTQVTQRASSVKYEDGKLS